MSTLKPMLAATWEGTTLSYPLLASPKLDGIRCLIVGGVALSRSLKPIRNETVQAVVAGWGNEAEGLDGELISGEHDATVFNRTTSVVMAKDGGDQWCFHAFDHFTWPSSGFATRLERARSIVSEVQHGNSAAHIRPVQHVTIHHEKDLLVYEANMLALGYEGIMLRSIGGAYKMGRSTVKEGGLLKVKRFADDEAIVIGVEEMMHNENEAKRDALGRTERSVDKAGLVPAGCLGALVCRRPDGVEFRVGSGFTAAQRVAYWAQHTGMALHYEPLVGKTVTYKHFPQGVKDAPRFPTFKGFRHDDDLSQ